MRKRENAKNIKKLKKRRRKSRPNAVYIVIRAIFDNPPKLVKMIKNSFQKTSFRR